MLPNKQFANAISAHHIAAMSGITAAEIVSLESFKHWIRVRPELHRRQEAVLLASRAALRVLPLVKKRPEADQEQFSELLVIVIWCGAISLVASTYPTREIASAASAAAASAAAASAYPASPAAVYAFYDAVYAAGADYAYVADAVYDSANAATNGNQVWNASRIDAENIEYGVDLLKLASQQIWPTEAPEWWISSKIDFEQSLQAPELSAGGFDIWLQWYDCVAFGKPLFGINNPSIVAELERNIALGSTNGKFDIEFWKREPALVNADIKRLVEDAKARDKPSALLDPESAKLPSLEELKQPHLNVTQFGQAANGQITPLAEGLEPANGRGQQDLQELYEEALQKLLALERLGANALGPLVDPMCEFKAIMPPNWQDVRINRLWSKLQNLRSKLGLHQAQMAKPQHDRDPALQLQEEAAEALRQAVQTFNVLIGFDRRGRELDQLQYGPGARQNAEERIAALKPFIGSIGDIGDNATVTIIIGDNNNAQNAPHDVFGDQEVIRVANQNENLVMSVAQVGWRIAHEFQKSEMGAALPVVAVNVAGEYGPMILEYLAKFNEVLLSAGSALQSYHELLLLIFYICAILPKSRQ